MTGETTDGVRSHFSLLNTSTKSQVIYATQGHIILRMEAVSTQSPVFTDYIKILAAIHHHPQDLIQSQVILAPLPNQINLIWESLSSITLSDKKAINVLWHIYYYVVNFNYTHKTLNIWKFNNLNI